MKAWNNRELTGGLGRCKQTTLRIRRGILPRITPEAEVHGMPLRN